MITNEEALKDMIADWEDSSGQVIRIIDSSAGTVERIVKIAEMYSIFRYVEMEGLRDGEYIYKIYCSVDLVNVPADRIIQELAERIP